MDFLRNKDFDGYVSKIMNDTNPHTRYDAFYGGLSHMFFPDAYNDDDNIVTDDEALICINKLNERGYSFANLNKSTEIVFGMIIERGLLKTAWRLIQLGYPKEGIFSNPSLPLDDTSEYITQWLHRLAMFATPVSGVIRDVEVIEEFYKNIFNLQPDLFPLYKKIIKNVRNNLSDRELYTHTWRILAYTNKKSSGGIISNLSNTELYESRKTREFPNYLQNRAIAYHNATTRY